jgi:hypothetical protein
MPAPTHIKGKPRFPGVFKSRTQQRIDNTLGIIPAGNARAVRKFRDPRLEKLDAYYDARQYDNLTDWEKAVEQSSEPGGEYVPIRKRKPRINYNLAKAVCARVTAKLIGASVWPTFNVVDDPDTTEYLRVVQKLSGLRHKLVEPVSRSLACGSAFVRFFVVEGVLQLESYQSKYCYPTFAPTGELFAVQIKYVFEDPEERDAHGDPVKKWYRLDLTTEADILYDNPVYREGEPEPEFQVVEQAEHALGFVQGEWFRTSEKKHAPDGPSLIEDALDFIDEFNYSLSQSSQAVSYNQDPQLVVKGVDEDELETLIRSATKAWNLGRQEASAEFLETSLTGVEAASDLRDRMKAMFVDLVRVVFLDPEKIVGSAQSAKAMEVLHGPLVELIDELRPQYEPRIKGLLVKMGVALLKLEEEGYDTAIVIPQGYKPVSLEVEALWPPIFPLTLEDLQKKVQTAASAKSAFMISTETAVRYIAKDFGVEDVEAEIAKIDADMKAQAAANPFGGF